MERIFIQIVVNNGKKHGIWQLDVTDLSLSELIRLKEEIKKSDYTPSITSLDSLIYNSMEKINGGRNIYGNGYVKERKRNIRNKRLKEIRR